MIKSDPYPYDFNSGSAGITFHLPSRRRFVPNAWLLRADMNENGTEIHLHYTHSLVMIEGTNLGGLLEQVAKFSVSSVCEMPTSKAANPTVTRIEITETASD